MRFEPERTGSGAGINASLFLPCRLVATSVDLAMMAAAERHRKLIADLATQRAWLGKAKMVRVGGRATANQTGLVCNEPYVVAIAKSARFGMA
jgi:hypothetical protein